MTIAEDKCDVHLCRSDLSSIVNLFVLWKYGGDLALTGVFGISGHVVRYHLWLKSTVVIL